MKAEPKFKTVSSASFFAQAASVDMKKYRARAKRTVRRLQKLFPNHDVEIFPG